MRPKMTIMMINSGLDGVVVAETRLSMVDGERGELIIAGVPVEELAANATFEETVELLWGESVDLSSRELPPFAIEVLRECARNRVDVMDALRLGLECSTQNVAQTLLSVRPALDEPMHTGFRPPECAQTGVSVPHHRILAIFPTIVATYWRLLNAHEPIAPRSDLSHAANYLWMLRGVAPSAEETRGLETYLNTVIDHGLNASTFTARVIASTGSDLVSAIVGALGALKGPLHGGAPGPALDMVFEIGDASRAEEVLRRKIESGEKLMGFGHRVYKVRDPRADVLNAAAHRLFTRGGDLALYELARAVEETALRLLEEYKPGRRLQTNVEFYTALLLHGLGLEAPLFTPTFAISRVAGWLAHCAEQRATGRIIRPQSVYVGVSAALRAQ
ncbi:MAG TPA: citrate synthase/methylcitrate synthase [Thermoanaerobaculia bacterium]|nr:citrate synthase/methylcitrate synthase [Thermoanaerobaculia bacterium]